MILTSFLAYHLYGVNEFGLNTRMFATIFGLLTSPIGSLITKIMGIIVAIGVLGAVATGAYIQWKSAIQAKDLATYNNQQLQINLKAQQDANKQIQQLDANQTEIVDQLRKQNEALTQKLAGATKVVSDPTVAKTDRTASDVLKQTIKQLGGK